MKTQKTIIIDMSDDKPNLIHMGCYHHFFIFFSFFQGNYVAHVINADFICHENAAFRVFPGFRLAGLQVHQQAAAHVANILRPRTQVGIIDLIEDPHVLSDGIAQRRRCLPRCR